MLVTINSILEGTLAKAEQVNTRFAAVLAALNGNIEADNIKNGAITNPLLANGAVATANIQDGAVTREKISSSTTTITSASTITPNAQLYIVTALAENATIAPVAGTPYTGQPLMLRITASGGARTLTWNAVYRGIGVTLPTSIPAGKTYYFAGRYNLEAAKWDLIGIGREA